jgi:hypothetical protein
MQLAAIYVGIACPGPNVTTCGRVGISVTLKRPALGADAILGGKRIRLHQGGLAGRGPRVWEGYVHLNRARLRLPRYWYGTKPVRFFVLRLTIRYAGGAERGSVRVQLRPGWG